MANLFKVLEEKIVWTKNWQNCPFKSEGESKTFPDRQKLRHFIIIRPALQEMLKSILQGNMKGHQTETQSHTKKKENDLNKTKYRSNYESQYYWNNNL